MCIRDSYQRGKGAASEVREAMPDAPGYSAVRAMPVSYTHLPWRSAKPEGYIENE